MWNNTKKKLNNNSNFQGKWNRSWMTKNIIDFKEEDKRI